MENWVEINLTRLKNNYEYRKKIPFKIRLISIFSAPSGKGISKNITIAKK